MKYFSLLLLLTLTVSNFSVANSHSGRTDSSGGHNCNVGSCAGTYHYHNGGPAYTPPPQPTVVPETRVTEPTRTNTNNATSERSFVAPITTRDSNPPSTFAEKDDSSSSWWVWLVLGALGLFGYGFYEESKQNSQQKIAHSNNISSNTTRFPCPRCGGVLKTKSGKYGSFIGCSNYRSKHCRYTQKV